MLLGMAILIVMREAAMWRHDVLVQMCYPQREWAEARVRHEDIVKAVYGF